MMGTDVVLVWVGVDFLHMEYDMGRLGDVEKGENAY